MVFHTSIMNKSLREASSSPRPIGSQPFTSGGADSRSMDSRIAPTPCPGLSPKSSGKLETLARGEVERLVGEVDAANETVKQAQDELLAAQVTMRDDKSPRLQYRYCARSYCFHCAHLPVGIRIERRFATGCTRCL